MKMTRQIYIAGKTILIRECLSKPKEKGAKRAPKINITTEDVWKNNLRYAIFKLTLILNANFCPGDLHLKLTYAVEPTKEQAKKDKAAFLRKLRSKCKKEGITFKWVATTERYGKSKRVHHHVICSKIPVSLVLECWSHGIAFHGELWDNPNYYELAKYIMKEADVSHREGGDIFKRRYTTSRNIVVPEGKEEQISEKNLDEDPTPMKGYQIDGEVNTYYHKILEVKCREYIQVSLTEAPRIKKWYKGITITGEKVNYSKLLREAYNEIQDDFFDSLI